MDVHTPTMFAPATDPTSVETMPAAKNGSSPTKPHPSVSLSQSPEKPPASAAQKSHRMPRKPSFRQLEDLASGLHITPMLWTALPVVLVFLLLSAFLELYVLTSAYGHLAIFGVGSYVVFSTYFVAMYYLERFSSSYTTIPDDKKFYVLSNLIKSAVLLVYCPLVARTLYLAFAHDDWSTRRIRSMGTLYAIPDFVSLLIVRRMAFTTKLHHVVVVIFMVANLFITYEEETVARALMVYAVFSTFAYLVNLLLASRFLPVPSVVSRLMSLLAFSIYAVCLALNWAWQLSYLWRLACRSITAGLVIYCAAMSFVVYDDLVLIRWLWHNMHRSKEAGQRA